jgi:Putative Flp pilus-assembly TadE/G-like/von Willebrand factor type A domain
VNPLLEQLRSQRGQTLPLIAVFMVVITGLAGLAIDVGNMERAKAAMQNAADAAALGGASTLLHSVPTDSQLAVDTADSYGMALGGKNPVDGIDPSSVSQTASAACDLNYSSCGPSTGPNTVTVHDTASVPTYFLSLFGIDSVSVSVNAEACAPCSNSPHDIMLVLDRTGSMLYPGKNNSSGESKIQLLKDSLLLGLLPTLDPDLDRVGIAVFPPNTASSGACDVKDNFADYYIDPTRTYLEMPPTGGFDNSDGTPNQSSTIVQLINCLTPAGATDYADPLNVAWSALGAWARPGIPKVIILISDGAANQIDDPNCRISDVDRWACGHPCQVGIQQANAIKNQGVTIYAIAYGTLGDDEYCNISRDAVWAQVDAASTMDGYDAMQQIASPGDYFADPDPSALRNILHEATEQMLGAQSTRLVK